MITAPLLLVAVLAAPPTFDDQWLKSSFPNLSVSSIQASGVEPWLELVLTDGQVVYATPDGEHLLAGSLIDLKHRENLTDRRRDSMRKDLIDGALPGELFEYPAPEGNDWVTVVTDIDCPYCRRLHQQMAEYHDAGISVRYVMMPRAGLGTGSHQKAVNAACAVDPASALTLAMNGESLAEVQCENTIEAQFRLARKLQVSGTPAILTESGRLLSGYVPPERLATEIQRNRDQGN